MFELATPWQIHSDLLTLECSYGTRLLAVVFPSSPLRVILGYIVPEEKVTHRSLRLLIFLFATVSAAISCPLNSTVAAT
jgi:hypothetical protein